MGLIDAFILTEFGAPTTREFFGWFIDQRLGFLMFDGLDEVILRDDSFIPYIETHLTNPQAAPLFLSCLRDSLLDRPAGAPGARRQ